VSADAGFSLLLAFDSDDEEFCRGVEAGRLWEQLKTGEEVHQTIHATNSEMAIRMCESLGREFSAEVLDDTWVEFIAPEAVWPSLNERQG
jgi:hypothetical protein